MSCVYFIGNEDFGVLKIGFTSDLDCKKRVASIQTSFPYELEVFCVIKLESETKARAIENKLHCALQSYNTKGEWFKIESATRLIIDECKAVFAASDGLPAFIECHVRNNSDLLYSIISSKPCRRKPETNKDDLINLLVQVVLIQTERVEKLFSSIRIYEQQSQRFFISAEQALYPSSYLKAKKEKAYFASILESVRHACLNNEYIEKEIMEEAYYNGRIDKDELNILVDDRLSINTP